VIHTRGESFDARDGAAAIAVEPGSAVVTIPDAHFLFTADFKRKGPDLVLTGEDGRRRHPRGGWYFRIRGQFRQRHHRQFRPGTDEIEIDDAVFADFQALLAATQDDGNGNAVITADPNDTITIKNVTVAQLVQHQGDFHFTWSLSKPLPPILPDVGRGAG
jgi:hypothetical protein